jgi:hypothetical protein
MHIPTQVSQIVVCKECNPDIILKSQDGDLFGASTTTLSNFNAFPFPRHTVVDQSNPEIVTLNESASVLKLLLQFMHIAEDQPELDNCDADTVIGLAEAVERYQVRVAQLAVRSALSYVPVIFVFLPRK